MAKEHGTIDGIARRLNRDVYYLALVDEAGVSRNIYTDVSAITDWLDAKQIGWSLCAGFDEDTVWIEGGPGCIFLDIHPELGPEVMEMVEAHFMDAEGEPSIPGYVPAMLRINVARKFAHRDDPDYWESF
jgi:hypothetical protein